MTISGPPSTLKSLLEHSSVPILPLPSLGLFNAPHIYDDADIRALIPVHLHSESGIKNARSFTLMSSASATPFEAETFDELLEAAVSEILTEKVDWVKLCETMGRSFATNDCAVLAFGLSHAANGILRSLKVGESGGDLSAVDLLALEKPERGPKSHNSKIAIVGMAGRFPDAASAEFLWQVLEQGRDVHRQIPKDRFDTTTHFDPAGKVKNTTHTPYGCFIEEPGLFDPRFFNMSPREASQVDPMQRLALTTAYEALEMAGYVPNRTLSTKLPRIGTFYGQASDDWREINSSQDVDTYFIPGGIRAFVPGRINYHFKFSGPSYSIDTACSSSFAAIHTACNSLWEGDCDTAIAGGVNVLTNPDIFSGLSRGQFLSKTGSCKTFDSEADGYCRADSVGSIVMKRLEDAEADKDNILGVILACGTNHSAQAISITHPHAPSQTFLYNNVLAEAGVNGHDVEYVEMHGTGTQAGDLNEMTSVLDSFADMKYGSRAHPLYIGTVKANVGHAEAAAGVTAMIKVLLMLQKNCIPPHCGIKGVYNPLLPNDLGERNVRIPLEPTPWMPHADGRRRLVFLNNFSAAGGNTSVLLEEGPAQPASRPADPRSSHVVAVSAKSISAIKRNLERLAAYLAENPNTDLADLSYTTTARRIQHNYRVAFPVQEISTVRSKLLSYLDGSFASIPLHAPKVVFAFTGQGSAYAALGSTLFETSALFKKELLYYEAIAKSQGSASFLGLVDGSADITTMPPSIMQLGLVCVQMALAHLWMSWGVQPSAVIGHSLGEYAALNIAGVLSTSDTIYLVSQRAKLLESNCTENSHAMLATRASLQHLQNVLGSLPYEVACANGPEETVLAGPSEQIDDLTERLAGAEIKCTKLKVPFAFHSSQVDAIMEQFHKVAAGAVFSKPCIPVISPLLGQAVSSIEEDVFEPTYLCRHAREKVNYVQAVQSAQADKIVDDATVWLEIGPHPVCTKFVKSSLKPTTTTMHSLAKNEDAWKTIAEAAASMHSQGLVINWSEYHRDFDESHRLLNIPFYGFDNKNYWLEYLNSWTLTKGEIPKPVVEEKLITAAPPKPKLSTNTVHRVVEEEFTPGSAHVVIESDFSNPLLHSSAQGHLVNDAALCPSSINGDIAFTVAKYAYEQMYPGVEVPGLDVRNMTVDKSFIVKPDNSKPQLLRVSATGDETGLDLEYYSVNEQGKRTVNHAACRVVYGDAEKWLSKWEQVKFLVQSRMDVLKGMAASGKAHRITRRLVYKLFGTFVEYDEEYQGMDEVILDANNFEATATINFKCDSKPGQHWINPHWIDSLAHISGFILNGTEAVDHKKQVYISQGWGSMRFCKTYSPSKTYHNYVRMQSGGGTHMVGDVYIFDGDEIIGMVGGIKFQAIPRKVLNTFLPPGGVAAKAAPAPAAAAPAPAKKSAAKPAKATPASTAQKMPAARPKPASNLVGDAMGIIAEECGIDNSELVDSCAFTSIGVDSLLSLTILARLREDLKMEISSNAFIDLPTIGEFKGWLASQAPAGESDQVVDDSYASDHSSSSSSVQSRVFTPEPTESVSDTDTDIGVDDDLSLVIRQTIADEMGVDIEEISGSMDLNSSGIDSLMSLAILASLREKTGLSLQSDFLSNCTVIDDIERSMAAATGPTKREIVAPTPVKPSKAMPKATPVATPNSALVDKTNIPSDAKAVSFLLQGNPKTASKFLFLFPDGSGSATSYSPIPPVGPDTCAYALNCPFMKTPEKFRCGIEGVTSIYLKEVRRRQPHGPYNIGGWSAGGVMAYEAALQLTAEGEKVERLILLDAPCPVKLEPVPSKLFKFFDSIGVLGNGNPKGTPAWVIPHFESMIINLDTYTPRTFPKGKVPMTHAIWARDGVCKNPTDPQPVREPSDPKVMDWLLHDRTDFKSNGWNQLLGDENMKFYSMDGNHFTMIVEPRVCTSTPRDKHCHIC